MYVCSQTVDILCEGRHFQQMLEKTVHLSAKLMSRVSVLAARPAVAI